MALSDVIAMAAAFDVESSAAAGIPLSGAAFSALGRFLSQDVAAWFVQGNKKPLLQQARESMALWRSYGVPPYWYLQSDLYLRHAHRDYIDHIPTYFADEFCAKVNDVGAYEWLEDKLEFDRRMRAMGLPFIPVFAVISLKDGALSVADVDGRPLSWKAFQELAHASSKDRIFVKPRHGVQGLGAFSLTLGAAGFERAGAPADEASLISYLSEFPFDEYVVQPFFVQHPDLQRLNPTSVNTIRPMTFRTGDEVEIFCAFLKAGAGDRETDNGSYGGYSAGCCLKTGAVTSPGKIWMPDASRSGDLRHKVTGVEFMALKIPFAQEIAELSIRGARLFAPIRLIGWDIAVGPDGPCIVEANIHPGFRGAQDLCGGLRNTDFGREISAEYGWR